MVIPIGDHNPTRRVPVVNWLLLGANIVIFVAFQPWWGDACTQQAFFLEWATVPHEVTSGTVLDADEVAATAPGCQLGPQAEKNVWVSILSGMFLHAGWLHLLGNMLYLWVFGNNIEDRLGHLGYLAFYLVSGAIATLAFIVPNAGSLATLVGASGAIAGVLGAYLVLYPGARVTVLVPFLLFLPLQLPALIVLGLWFLLQLAESRVAGMAGGGVAYLAHIAGFVAGAMLVGVLGLRSRPRGPQRHYDRA